jgi:hypothetical protein
LGEGNHSIEKENHEGKTSKDAKNLSPEYKGLGNSSHGVETKIIIIK